MDPKQRLLSGRAAFAALAALAIALGLTAPAHAQLFDDVLQANGLQNDVLSRSPRLLGMGRLSLVVDDVHHRYDLWEFSGNPAGLLDADSVSTLEFYPSTAASAAYHDDPIGGSTARQDLGLRDERIGYEAWRRQSGSSAFGIMGDYTNFRTDTPETFDSEQRTQFIVPNTMLLIGGKLAFFEPERFRYGLAIHHRYQDRQDVFRTNVVNAAGQFIDQDGTTINPPVELSPDEYSVRSLGGTVGGAYHVAGWLELGASYDYLGNQIEGQNKGFRYAFELRESRPVSTESANAIGSIGSLGYGVNARHWSSGPNEQRWVATLSTGSGFVPVVDRGKYENRKESGNEFDGRATWTLAALTLSAGGSRTKQTIDVVAPDAGDPQSFNTFLEVFSTFAGTDTLALPDSVRTNASDETTTEFGGGAAYRLGWHHSVLGVEAHVARDQITQTFGGPGPNPSRWDVRSGAEIMASPALAVRGGYVYEHLDRDRLTANNEYVTQMVTAGFALHPVHASWTIETGYGVGWTGPDFGDPTRSRSTDQRGLARIRWSF